MEVGGGHAPEASWRISARYIEGPVVNADTDAPIAEVPTRALGHPDEPLPLGDLAARATIARRNFVRRFREATGPTPAAG
ncbi:hypothetical protein [Kineosporia succinea]|uniref:Transcriptional regulator GlxA family with amidase domain n=1 Tax=Kineosporia succinea TaxID=84632 RepID=A0ABT9NW58_9ACTN|nr:transcriptional regulator GlxA family with amidase domain [Kineosporia succinea]